MKKSEALIILSQINPQELADWITDKFLEESSDPDVWSMDYTDAVGLIDWIADQISNEDEIEHELEI